ncbi:hypothetical protein BOM_0674 [Borrelia miyamotoi FR64b]|nr:hypothetical protein BOM_0674 [Borrelia miyamotoi FR64b]
MKRNENEQKYLENTFSLFKIQLKPKAQSDSNIKI